MNANNTKNIILTSAAAAGSFLIKELGGSDAILQLLVLFMAADYITGTMIAAVWKKSNKSDGGSLDSRAGFKGLCKKCTIFLLVGVGVALDRALNIDYLRATVILFFIGNEGLSLLENSAIMGVPWPDKLKDALEVLKSKGGGK